MISLGDPKSSQLLGLERVTTYETTVIYTLDRVHQFNHKYQDISQ